MKKGFLFGAMLSAFALVGCVDSNESASVEAVRNSKAEEQKALAAMYNAQAAAATTQAQAEAALAQAEAALVQAHAELTQAQAEYQKIKNEYEKDKNNIELQTLLAQAEAAKAAAEQQIQQIKDQMELAVINQQKAIAEAQLALKQALATLKAEDANEFKTYSYAYTNALNEVYNLQNWLANAKQNLELYKLNNNLETQLADNGKFVEGQIARYEGYIANNEQTIENLKKQLPELEAYLKMLSECEECKAGDLTALKIKLNEKTHEWEHARDAYNEKHDGIVNELNEAVSSAQNAMWSQAGQALRQAYKDAEQAMLDDEFYKLVKDSVIIVDETSKDYSGNNFPWRNLGLYPSFGDSETYKKTWKYLVAEAEYVNWLGDTEKVEYKLSDYFNWVNPQPYELSASYRTSMSADQIRIAKEQYEKQYAEDLKNADHWIATYKWNEAQFTKYAQRMEAAAKSDSVAIDHKNYTDSLQLTWSSSRDSVIIDTVPGGFIITASDLDINNPRASYSYKMFYNNANSYRRNAEWEESWKESILAEQAAYKKFVDMVDNSETYAAEYAKKVDAYYAAMAAYVKDLAEATVKLKAFNWNMADEEWNAVLALEKEKDALDAAVTAMQNNNNAIETLENQIKGINDQIALNEVDIEDYKAAIEEAKAKGKVSEERIKLIYENVIASYEADIKNYEEQIAVKQTVVDMYKAILDSLVAEDAE